MSNRAFSPLQTRRVLFWWALATCGVGRLTCPGLAYSDEVPVIETMTETPSGDAKLPLYSVRPQGEGKLPIVLVIPDTAGLDGDLKAVCKRLAGEAYLVVAPDLFFRQGDVTEMTYVQVVKKVLRKTRDEEMLKDCAAALTWARDNGGDGARAAACGIGWGGRFAWVFAAHSGEIKCAVAWYSWLWLEPDDGHWDQPVNVIDKLKSPVLGIHGTRDQSSQQGLIEPLRDLIRESGKPSDIIVLNGARGTFLMQGTKAYRKEAAEEGWKRMSEWFRHHGVK